MAIARWRFRAVGAAFLLPLATACGSSDRGASNGDEAGVTGTRDGAGAAAVDASNPVDSGGPLDAANDGPAKAPADAAAGDGAALPQIHGFAPGTNLSGAEFGSPPGVYGTGYTYPTHAEVDYFTGKGFKIIRIPFLWERMQPTLGQPLDTTQLGYLTDLATYVTSKGAYALIDPHNYARYNGQIIGDTDGGSTVSSADFATFWGKLATAFAGNTQVVFGLMNEPHDLPTTTLWLTDANAAIAAIRSAGATNVIFVPGNGWTGAHSWLDNDNGAVMLGVKDPLSNYVFEVHQYLDSNFSGTSATCASTTIGSQSLAAFQQWMSDNHVRGFLGEFGAAFNPTCMSALDDALSSIDQRRDLWVGWTWWSAGPWWGAYDYSIEPTNGMDAPQTATLLKHL